MPLPLSLVTSATLTGTDYSMLKSVAGAILTIERTRYSNAPCPFFPDWFNSQVPVGTKITLLQPKDSDLIRHYSLQNRGSAINQDHTHYFWCSSLHPQTVDLSKQIYIIWAHYNGKPEFLYVPSQLQPHALQVCASAKGDNNGALKTNIEATAYGLTYGFHFSQLAKLSHDKLGYISRIYWSDTPQPLPDYVKSPYPRLAQENVLYFNSASPTPELLFPATVANKLSSLWEQITPEIKRYITDTAASIHLFTSVSSIEQLCNFAIRFQVSHPHINPLPTHPFTELSNILREEQQLRTILYETFGTANGFKSFTSSNNAIQLCLSSQPSLDFQHLAQNDPKAFYKFLGFLYRSQRPEFLPILLMFARHPVIGKQLDFEIATHLLPEGSQHEHMHLVATLNGN